MSRKYLGVNRHELDCLVGPNQFLALPREEVERVHASIDVVPMEQTELSSAPYIQLYAYTIVHHNYLWLTYSRTCLKESQQSMAKRSMGLCAPMLSNDNRPVFLEEAMRVFACEEAAKSIIARDGFHLRFAGLVRTQSKDLFDDRLGLVYVARLGQADFEIVNSEIDKVRLCGNGDLLMERNEFEPWSRLLIESLHAF